MSARLPPSAPAAELAHLLRAHPKAVVFTGAGMSTESGLPDFRSTNLGPLKGFPSPPATIRGEPSSPAPHARGLWKQNRRFEELASRKALETDYDEHVAFYRWRIQMLAGHEPNDGHRVVADWQRRGLVTTIVTQNVDGFHTRAGAENVLELHGTLANVRCDRCGEERPAAVFLEAAGLICDDCGGKRRPGVVLFGEALPTDTLRAAWMASERAPLYIVLGSSLAVAPANLLPEAAVSGGAPLVIVNRDPTPLDRMATLVINAGIGETLRAADQLLRA